MQPDRFTVKSQEAVADTLQLASRLRNPEAAPAHLLVALLGFLAGNGNEIFNLIPVNTEDNFLHLLIGLAGVGGGLATPGTAPPSTQRPAVA